MFSLLKLGIKAGLATSAVYLTVDNGVWKDSQTTLVLYNQLTSQASQYLTPYLEKVPLPDLPHSESTAQSALVVWNAGVKSTGKFLVGFPVCAGAHMKKWYRYAEEQIQIASNPPTNT